MFNRKRLLIILALIFAVGILIALFYDSTICEGRRVEINNKINLLKNTDSIEGVILSKTFPRFNINLVDDTTLITNHQILSAVRKSILERKSAGWIRTPPEWFVNLTIVINENNRLTIRASKINNDTTHLFFGDTDCMDREFIYSTTLNGLLENVSCYHRKK
jgi:hypothetical protein